MDDSLLAALPDWPAIRSEHAHWLRFMRDQVEFSLADSTKHTKDHCARVLLYALTIAHRRGLFAADRAALGTAAAFHDSRRQDDWYDVGHGARAAAYYREFCAGSALPFDARTEAVMAYHDRDDEIGEAALQEQGLANGVELYRVFKDADGLDRFRLGPNALDAKMLRTPEARDLVDFARAFVEADLRTEFASQ